MEIRQITKEEVYQAAQLGSICFEYGFTEPKDPAELLDRPNALERVAAFEDEEMVACVTVNPFTILFDGKPAGMAGMGGVCTLPHRRRKGYVRDIFRHALEQAREKGQEFSMLHAFYQGFYRRLGYENTMDIVFYKVGMTGMPKSRDIPGSFSLYRPGDDLSPFREAYGAFAARYNGMSLREEPHQWRPVTRCDCVGGNNYCFLYRDQTGAPAGYLAYFPHQEGEKRLMLINELVFRSPAALKAILQFAATFASHYTHVAFTLPASVDAAFLFDDISDRFVTRELRPSTMVRVVDVEKVLQKAAYLGSGEVALEIRDDLCPWNEGVWTVTFRDGTCSRVEKNAAETGPKAQATLDISAFSRLIFHPTDAFAAQLLPGCALHTDYEALRGIFHPKQAYCLERF